MGDFLKEISNPQIEQIKYDSMINIILIHCSNVNDESIQLTAMMWLKELTNLSGERALYFMPGILNVTLPCISYGDDYLKKNTKDLARSINATLWVLIDKSSGNVAADANQSSGLAIEKLIESLTKLMITPSDQQSVLTTIEALKWMLHLVNKQPNLVS